MINSESFHRSGEYTSERSNIRPCSRLNPPPLPVCWLCCAVCCVGQYWIIDLGPIEGGQYQYSVVTDKYAQTLFILVTTPHPPLA